MNSLRKDLGLDDPKPIPYVIPTGSLSLDRATGIGGYPGGRIVELYGPESGGKSTLAMHACVQAERMGLPFAYVDMENALDVGYFKRMGLSGEPNVDWLHVSPETGEDAFTTVDRCIESGMKLVVVDSVAAMTPLAELQGEMGEAFMGLQARMMGQGLRKSVGPAGRAAVTVIFINQVRMKIGVTFGNPEVTTGGGALKFYSSMRLDVRQQGDPIEDSDGNPIGRYSRVKLVKNKVAPPMRVAQVPIIWGRGIAEEYDLFDEAVTGGLISKTSSYFTYRDERVNGKVAAISMVARRAAEIREDLSRKVEGGPS